jgi:nucleotide-binding universal stress UspA family protein
MQTILVHISGGQGQSARLQASLDIARAFSGHITLCQPAPPPIVAGGLAPGTIWTTVSFVDMEQTARESREKTKAQVNGIMHGEDVPWDWVDVQGFTQEAFASQTALTDLAVVTLSEEDFPFESNEPFLSHVVTKAACPVLAMPQDATGFDPFGTVLIAWDGSFEAATAVKGALPLLSKASDIIAVSVGPMDPNKPNLTDLAQYLSRAGLSITTDTLAKDGHISDTLMETAKATNASYIVMGAYGHSRLLETILGGETNRMLQQNAIPVLFGH